MNVFKKFFKRPDDLKLRSGIKPPVKQFDRHGKPVTQYYLDIEGYSDPSKNPRLGAGVGLKYRHPNNHEVGSGN